MQLATTSITTKEKLSVAIFHIREYAELIPQTLLKDLQ